MIPLVLENSQFRKVTIRQQQKPAPELPTSQATVHTCILVNSTQGAKDYGQLRPLVSFLGRNPSITDTYAYSVLILSNYKYLSRDGEGRRGLITQF